MLVEAKAAEDIDKAIEAADKQAVDAPNSEQVWPKAYNCCWRPARPPRSTSTHSHPSPLPFTPPSLICTQVVVPAPAPTLSTPGAGSDDYDDDAYESDEAAVVPVSFSDESHGTANNYRIFSIIIYKT